MRLFLSGLGVLLFLVIIMVPSRSMAEEGMFASIRLPMTVRILDFETTKEVCGQFVAPHWCPSHLLRKPDDVLANDDQSDVPQFESALLSKEEVGKRLRINAVKSRLRAEGKL